MHRFISFIAFSILTISAHAQSMVAAADKFISLLDTAQHTKTVYPFGSEERYSFHYFPINDRKGLPLDEMTDKTKKLLRSI